MNHPLFSVVVPVYNRADIVRQTLDSIFAQGRPNLDVIVVDDGSTDNTVSVLRSYGDRIKLIQQKNQGPGSARNAGIDVADGEYVAFLDSDDLWFPWTLDQYEALIGEYDRPAFIAGEPFLFSESKDVQSVGADPVQSNYFPDYFSSSDAWRWWGVSSFVVRTDALCAAGGFTDRWINAEDADLALRLGTAGGFVEVHGGPTFAYREHKGTAMDDASNTVRGALHLVASEKTGAYPGGEARQQERRRILCRHVRPPALTCLRNGDREAAWQLYRETFAWHVALHRWKFLGGFPARAVQYRLQNFQTS